MPKKIVDVQYVNEKGGYYSFKAEDDVWYGCGDVQPRFEKGDKIKFEYSTNTKDNRTYNNVDMDTVKVAKGKGTVKPYKGKGGGRGGASAEYYKWRKEFDIQGREELRYAGARNAAIEVVKVLAELSALTVGKTPKATQKAVDSFIVALTNDYIGRLPNVEAPVAEEKVEVAAEEPADPDFSDLEDDSDFTEDDDDGFND